MKIKYSIVVFNIVALWYLCAVTSCVHDPLGSDDMGPMPVDTMMVDTMVIDTMTPGDTTVPCDPSVVYFSTQVLPILRANCAQSGCHNQTTAQEDIVLESFATLMASEIVVPFDLSKSDLFEVLTETDLSKRMPPPPANRLATDQINIIAEWILQGAQNLSCNDDTTSGCNTDNISFASDIAPVINLNCRTCHSGGTPAGGIDLSSYSGVQSVALNGRLVGAIDRLSGFVPMPQGGAKLDDCTIDKFKSWIADGAQNN